MSQNRDTKSQPLNPRDTATYPADDAARGKGDGMNVAHNGYAILDRVDVRSRYEPNRAGLSDPVYSSTRFHED